MTFSYDARSVHVHFERDGAAAGIQRAVQILGLERILLIASRRELPRARTLTESVSDRIIAEYSAVVQHVPADTADDATRAALDAGAGGLLSIGGGSALGTAKVIAHRTGLPIIAVPTTYSGSEMTATWGVTSEGRKVTAVDEKVAPRAVIYDPALLAGLPDGIAIPSAFNAMAHCIEALWVTRANPIIGLVATEGIAALAGGLERLAEGGGDAATDDLLYGAFLGGMALGAVGSGLHHKICHALGGAFDSPHAETHTVILPWVLELNAPAVPEISGRIASALGAEDPVTGLRRLYARVGAPTTLTEIGIPVARLDDAIAAVESRLPVDNPRPVGRADIEMILRGAFGVR